jgi:hypothetical protein
MSQENVQVVRGLVEKTFRDIRAFVDAAKRGEADMSMLDPDVVYEDQNLPDHIGETYRGHAGIVRAAERWAEASETLTIPPERIVGSGATSSPSTQRARRRDTRASSSKCPSPTRGHSETGRSFTSGRFAIQSRPSKPPGCGSRRRRQPRAARAALRSVTDQEQTLERQGQALAAVDRLDD